MGDKQNTPSYAELSGQAYALFVDAFAQYNQRTLAYSRSLWEIVSRPYASTAIESTVRDNFERANQIVSLTVDELSANGSKGAEFAEKLTQHAAKVQDAAAEAFRGAVSTSISNMNYVKDTTAQQFDDLTKRLDDVQARATSSVSHN